VEPNRSPRLLNSHVRSSSASRRRLEALRASQPIAVTWRRAHWREIGRAKHVERAAIGIALLLVSPPGAWSRPVRMTECFPAAQAIVDGNNVQYIVRFDGLVDHEASRMWITTGARVARTLTPNLNSAPEVLFASSPRLPPGNYQLHWSAKSVPDPDLTDGSVDFAVGQ
jgi:hypothetical protein